MNKMSETTRKLVTCGVLIALGTILSMIKFSDLPFGGSVTLFSMVPMVVLGYKYGIKWGLFSGLIFSALQAILGATTSHAFAGVTGWSVVAMAFLDYIVAFTVLGLSGMFKNKIKNHTAAITTGAFVVVMLRFVSHFASGWILWGSYAEGWFADLNNAFGEKVLATYSGQALSALYSFVYNGSYMIPELILTVIGVLALMAVKPVRKLIVNENA